MPQILPNTNYNDGQLLDVDGHNQNVYDTAAGHGIMSEINGGMEPVNLAPGFRVREEHVMPGLSVRMNREFALRSVDCFEDAFAADVNHATYTYDTAPAELWVPVPGCAISYYTPVAGNVIGYCNLFFDVYRLTMVLTDDVDVVQRPAVAVALMVDGVIQEHTKRPLPVTAKYSLPASTASLNTGPATTATDTDNTERITAQWWQVHFGVSQQAAGTHDVQLVMYMESARWTFTEYDTVDTLGGSFPDGTKAQVVVQRARVASADLTSGANVVSPHKVEVSTRGHILFNRAAFGIRGSRVLVTS